MKLRAVLLIAILIGGLYTIIQTHNDYKEKQFTELINSINDNFTSLSFTVPAKFGISPEVWVTEDDDALKSLLTFLQNYTVQKLKPEETPSLSTNNQFSLHLESERGDAIVILVEENLIVMNSLSYYEIVNGPLNQDWMVQFFTTNQVLQ